MKMQTASARQFLEAGNLPTFILALSPYFTTISKDKKLSCSQISIALSRDKIIKNEAY